MRSSATSTRLNALLTTGCLAASLAGCGIFTPIPTDRGTNIEAVDYDKLVPGTSTRAEGQHVTDSSTIEKYLGRKFIIGYVAAKRAEHENFKRVISSWEREFLLFAV